MQKVRVNGDKEGENSNKDNTGLYCNFSNIAKDRGRPPRLS